jgi:hypothetical protein
MVLVTPDAERSMCTFLGATSQLDAQAFNIHFQRVVIATDCHGNHDLVDGGNSFQAIHQMTNNRPAIYLQQMLPRQSARGHSGFNYCDYFFDLFPILLNDFPG